VQAAVQLGRPAGEQRDDRDLDAKCGAQQPRGAQPQVGEGRQPAAAERDGGEEEQDAGRKEHVSRYSAGPARP